MADTYTWNDRNHPDRKLIDQFLNVATRRMAQPIALPFRDVEGRFVVAWLHGLVDRKPSEIET